MTRRELNFGGVVKALLIGASLLALIACQPKDERGKRGADGSFGADGISQSALDPASAAFFTESIGDRVFFAIDESRLSPEAIALLDEQADWLLDNSDISILIEGHTDEQGTREYNLALGARRAASVQNYLVSRGLPFARLRTITYGKERPDSLCSNESCYQDNRRAVTVLEGGGF